MRKAVAKVVGALSPKKHLKNEGNNSLHCHDVDEDSERLTPKQPRRLRGAAAKKASADKQVGNERSRLQRFASVLSPAKYRGNKNSRRAKSFCVHVDYAVTIKCFYANVCCSEIL